MNKFQFAWIFLLQQKSHSLIPSLIWSQKVLSSVDRLENMQFDEWHDKVTVVSCDMRLWEAPEKADIVVSELLGSFGDNELSPECLDGAQRFMKGKIQRRFEECLFCHLLTMNSIGFPQ